MKSFKQFFFESVESEANLPPPPAKFNVPPPKAKFQLGDVILVQTPSDDEYIKRVMPKYLHSYVNAVGRIIGHRIVGISTDYAVEFEDGKIAKVKSGLLVGPFRSFASAKKYQGRENLVSADIAPEDHKRFAEAQSTIEVNDDIENTFKKLFVDQEGFKWLDSPIPFNVGLFKIVVLATKPNNYTKDPAHKYWGNTESPDFIKDYLVFYKTVDLVSNKLTKTSTFNRESRQAAYGLIVPSSLNSLPQFRNGKVVDHDMNFYNSAITSAKILSQKQQEFAKANKLFSTKDGMEWFDLYNNVKVEGNTKIVEESTYYYGSSILKEITDDTTAFKNYIFNTNVSIRCQVNGQMVFPKEVKGDLNIIADNVIKNFAGFPKVHGDIKIRSPFQSLAGLPTIIDKDLEISNANSLKEFPKVIKGNCTLSHLKSFEGAENSVVNGTLYVEDGPSSFQDIPKASKYVWYGKTQEETEKIEQWVKKGRQMTKAIQQSGVEKEFDLSALEDF